MGACGEEAGEAGIEGRWQRGGGGRLGAGERVVAAAGAGVTPGERVRVAGDGALMNPFTRFETIVAFRFMREGLTQTLLIVFGVALGAGVIIFMSALLAGLQSNIVRRTLNFQAPIEILAPDQVPRSLREGESARVAAQVQPRSQQLRSVDQWQKVRAEVAQIPGVIGVTPVVSGPGFARRGEAIKSVTITGIDIDSYFDVIALPGEDRRRPCRRRAARHHHRHRAGQGPRHGRRRQGEPHHRRRRRDHAHGDRHIRFRQQGRERAQRLRGAAYRAEPARPGRRRVEHRRSR